MPLFGPNVKKMQAKGDVEGLIEALHHKGWDMRQSASLALGQMRDPRAVESLSALLHREGEKFDVRKAAANALAAIGDVHAVKALTNALNHDEEHVREVATVALGGISDAQVAVQLVSILSDEDFYVRRGAAEALKQIGAPAVEPLITTLRDAGENARATAAGALGHVGDARAAEPLIAALNDTSKDVRQAAAEALGHIGDARAVEPLIAVLKGKDTDVRSVAAAALTTITGEVFELNAFLWQQWWQNQQAGKVAAKPKEPVPGVRTYVVQKSEVLSADISRLSPVVDERIDAARKSQSWFLLDLHISGYDLDPRALWELVEVRRWFELASKEWPFLPYLLTSESCRTYLYCTMPVKLQDRALGLDRVAIGGTPEAALKMQRMFDAGNKLCLDELAPSDRGHAKRLAMQATSRIQAAMSQNG